MEGWMVIALRSIGAVAILFTMTRILGKKQISQLTTFEYITGIALGELAGFLSTDIEAHYMHGIVAIAVWFTIPFGLELLTLKSKRLREWFEGKATVVVKDGKILEDNLKKERFTGDELMESLRTKNVFRVADVEFAMLETSGALSVLLKNNHQPLTPAHLGIDVSPEKEPQTVIIDGNIMDEPLSTIGFSREWLSTELEKIGVTYENVFIAQVDAYGQLYVDLFDDQLQVPAPQTRALLLSTLKKCEADLELFGMATDNVTAKLMYEDCATRMKRVIETTTPLLKR
ncbi:DUF421 domain-containing protein [Paenibacillus contaminans]|uniref:DUF421 domain-containing protein n=1 Tax=Paenibacillus contaminans TaxID=450362 RepID=A0A329MQK9_9BACL|nr:DUF421 domain-containing protein [Paenibacillus contaminans]RAV21842.1 hypothetical protein DQG23_07230 [Paenibacillus contaminans]